MAAAIQQLHSGRVSHNDIKPANFLVFKYLDEVFRQKLGDLGSATSPLIPSLRDEAICAGDRRYAAPEVLYATATDLRLCNFEARRALDLYLLGSMVYFLISGRMLTPEIVRNLVPEQRQPSHEDEWHGDFRAILPYWRESFGRVLSEFASMLPRERDGSLTYIGTALLNCVLQLSDPDPQLRGHPLNRGGQADRLSVQQYISLFDVLRRRVLH